MVIPRIKEKLQNYPDVIFTESENHLEIPAQNATGFSVWIQVRPRGYTIGFDGWYEKFTDGDQALNCFAFGLSTACRLRVFTRGNTDYKWQVLHQVDGQWVPHSETGMLIFPFWRRKAQRELGNELIKAV